MACASSLPLEPCSGVGSEARKRPPLVCRPTQEGTQDRVRQARVLLGEGRVTLPMQCQTYARLAAVGHSHSVDVWDLVDDAREADEATQSHHLHQHRHFALREHWLQGMQATLYDTEAKLCGLPGRPQGFSRCKLAQFERLGQLLQSCLVLVKVVAEGVCKHRHHWITVLDLQSRGAANGSKKGIFTCLQCRVVMRHMAKANGLVCLALLQFLQLNARARQGLLHGIAEFCEHQEAPCGGGLPAQRAKVAHCGVVHAADAAEAEDHPAWAVQRQDGPDCVEELRRGTKHDVAFQVHHMHAVAQALQHGMLRQGACHIGVHEGCGVCRPDHWREVCVAQGEGPDREQETHKEALQKPCPRDDDGHACDDPDVHPVRVLQDNVHSRVLQEAEAQPPCHATRQGAWQSRHKAIHIGQHRQGQYQLRDARSPRAATQLVRGHTLGADNVNRPTTAKGHTEQVAQANGTEFHIKVHFCPSQDLHGLQVRERNEDVREPEAQDGGHLAHHPPPVHTWQRLSISGRQANIPRLRRRATRCITGIRWPGQEPASRTELGQGGISEELEGLGRRCDCQQHHGNGDWRMHHLV
mmetsp:Transcript_103380/g.287859  ORF Transcript_103380/g.287859 Transcript_103380/m.287859 type:complete len:583 (-) Transcript_103380:786-2534(-)